jgi:acetyl-CoA synthetase
LIYTSGTTGNPKGALIPQQALIGNLTGFVCSQNWFGFEPHASSEVNLSKHALPTGSKAIFWSPADWAWTGGLMDALLPSLYFGRPIVAFKGRFSPELAFEILHTHGITHSFLFPTALKAMMKAQAHPRQHYKIVLKGLMSAGEAVGDAVFAYCRDELGVVVNEMFGQTEINYVVGNCQVFWPSKAGSMGRGYPGHQVAVIDEQGHICKPGEAGEVVVNRFDRHGQPDPVFFLGYWKNPSATLAKYTGQWCRTGDVAIEDEDGYLWYQGRTDDMFKSAGYRIGPGEIENCLVKHPAVMNAAVVPKPDADRGALVKAYVVLSPEFVAQRVAAQDVQHFESRLIEDLQRHVRGLLAPYEYPKEIEFIEQLPMTTTGKVQRRFLRLQEEERVRQNTKM